MSKKIPLGVSITALLVAVALTAVITVFSYKNIYNNILEDLPQRKEQYSRLNEIEELVRTEYYGSVDYGTLNDSLASGYVEGLNDNRSFYISADNYKAYNDYLNGKIAGCGLTVSFDSEKSCLEIKSIDENSSASSAGLKTGMMIYSVDGTNVSAENYSKLVSKLDGDAGETVKLGLVTFLENDEISRNTVSVRNGYSAVTCTSSVSGEIGYIRISSFNDNTNEKFREELASLIEEGIKGLIIDVRNNNGTDIYSAVKITDRIVPLASDGTGAVATAKNSRGDVIEIFPADSESLNIPIAVLINDRTAGAAELLACDLRDFGKARLVGEKTAGVGTMQKLFKLNDGSAIVLSIARIYPYISDPYDNEGITPDDAVKLDEGLKNTLESLDRNLDTQYLAAYAYLAG